MLFYSNNLNETHISNILSLVPNMQVLPPENSYTLFLQCKLDY